ncbi:MAG: complex I subunit 5 family protein, partial [Lachnospiraceae bacterium]
MSGGLMLIPICLPVLGGLYIFFRKPKTDLRRLVICEIFTLAASAMTFAVIFSGNRDMVHVFSFMKGFSIAFRVDGPAMLFAGMVSAMWPFVLLYAKAYMEKEHQKDKFFAFFTMTYGVTLGLAFSANLVTMYVFFEMLTLVTIPLVSHYEDHDSLYAGRQYAAYCIGGASLGFIAVVFCSL